MVLAGVLLIILAIVRFFVDCSNIFVAFIRHDPREARLAYLEDVTQPLFITKHCIFITALFIGDSFVVRLAFSLSAPVTRANEYCTARRTIGVGSSGARRSGSSSLPSYSPL